MRLPVARDTSGSIFDVEDKQRRTTELEAEMSQAGFWDSREHAQIVVAEVSRLKQVVVPIIDFRARLEEVEVMGELLAESTGEDATEFCRELESSARKLEQEINSLEVQSFLSGPHDRNNAYLSIHAGAGGTESCDWADMLLRMYLRWGERRGFDTEIEDMQAGEEAGISRVTVRIAGEHAYGYAKAERGIHRLVRISPFDSNRRRHTSFSAVDVIAEIEDDTTIQVRDDELRIDTYRSSGKGGQHVNKTDSAVRLTHLPTGIVVACQNERSQHKNKATAMKILKARIYEKLADEKRAEMEKFYGEKNEIGWGNQIRSYVLQPYQMVKDLRTGEETSNVRAVMDGDLDSFVHAWLRAGCPSIRSKNTSQGV